MKTPKTPTAARPLIVAERFGPTLQGEGPSAGQRAVFIRLSRCNLACRWCDTPYTWDWTRFDPRAESFTATAEDLASWALSMPAPLVVITGGEPMLQQPGLVVLASALHAAGRRVEIETNGTIAPTDQLVATVDQFNVSPKLAGSGIPAAQRIDVAILRRFAASGKTSFKFVLDGPEDIRELVALERDLRPSPVWVMPQAITPETLTERLKVLADVAIAHGWNLSNRLHVLLWGDQRGR